MFQSRKIALAALIGATLLAQPALAVNAEPHVGKVTQTLSNAYALAPNSSPLPEKDEFCKANNGLLGQEMTTKYSVNTQTLIETAVSKLGAKIYKLHPLGLADQYAFGLYQNGPVWAVLFSTSTSFDQSTSSAAVKEDGFTCVYSSAPQPSEGLKQRLSSVK